MSNAVAQRQESAPIVQAGESATILQVIQRAAADPQCDIEKMERLILCRKQGALGALLMLDLDDFKLLNDSCGHIAGDQALIEVGRRLQSALRPDDLVGRLGGDEFIVYMNDLPDRTVIANRSEFLCEKLRPPFDADTHLAASMGISVCPDDGDTFELLYQKADSALYHAKRTGKNHRAFYSEDMGDAET